MDNIKAITHIPGWAELLESSDKVSQGYNAYAAVPLVFRALKLRCDALSSVPVQFFRGEQQIEWGFETQLAELLWQTEAALLLTGAAYWYKLSNTVRVVDVAWLNPYSVTVEYDQSDGSFTFTQQAGSNSNEFTQDDIVYFREFDPTQDTHPGVAPANVGLTDAQVQHYMTRFAWRFFEGGAMPVTILGMEQVSDSELKRVEGVFTRMMASIKNAFKIIGVRADAVDIKTITPPLKDLTMPDLYDQSKKNIANAFGVPVTMLEDPSANRATAGVHHFSFWSETIRPRGRLYENTINNQLLDAGGIRMRFDFDSLDVFQEDEAQRSSSLLNLVNARIPADVAVEILGFDLTEEQFNRIAEAQQTRDEQREAVLENVSAEGQAESQQEKLEEQAARAMRRDLGRWRKNALTRLKSGRNPARMFSSDHLPEDIVKRIYTLLRMSKSAEDIDDIFDRFMALDFERESPDIGELVDALRGATEALQNE